jgi:hypothetical protein
MYTGGILLTVLQFMKFVHDILAFAQPWLLGYLMSFISSYNTDNPQPSYYGFFISGMLR